MDRRSLLKAGLAVAAGAAAGPIAAGERLPAAPPAPPPPIRPPRLREGDLVALVAPANATFLGVQLDVAREALEALGLRVRIGEHLLSRYGSMAGRDAERAADVDAAFADPEVRAVLPIRGGWGSARLLPHLDYDLARRDPKVVLGYSDVTALLLALHARSGLVTFHGPNGFGRWDPFSVDHVRRLLFAAEAPTLANPVDDDPDRLVPLEHRIRILTPGRARGRLVGGNLTVLAGLVGTPYLPSFDGAILFVEDTNEAIYRIDRLMTQLALAGLLGRIAGFVFGTCEGCGPGEGYGSLTLEEVLRDHVGALGVPAWHGAMIGHGMPQWTVPIGAEAEIDADAGTVRLLEAAVAEEPSPRA
ncbi:MAG TPA: LD-carboxypeptidase [Thermoanaerobaculia bacterium]|nr:LD-carboxypeptidase [Thermoanaerobaculia bacterium]